MVGGEGVVSGTEGPSTLRLNDYFNSKRNRDVIERDMQIAKAAIKK